MLKSVGLHHSFLTIVLAKCSVLPENYQLSAKGTLYLIYLQFQ